MTDHLALLNDVANAVGAALGTVADWGPSGGRQGQYALDVVTDEAALAVLRRAGVAILSEESGFEPGRDEQVVVIDPIDGSTNASRGVPWFSTALCLLDADGPAVALVADQANGTRYWAQRGAGAWRDGRRLQPSGCDRLAEAIVGVSGPPPVDPGWAQFRALGACALDLCLVAEGVLDGYLDCVADAHGVWDYLAGTLICAEAGAVVADARGRQLAVRDHTARRTPIAAATPSLHDALLGLYRRL